MDIVSYLARRKSWEDFLQYKTEKQHLSGKEQKQLAEYIDRQGYMPFLDMLKHENPVFPLPIKSEINKGGTAKKRVVYSYPPDFNLFLKMITFCLYQYDYLFADNCYAFRRDYGAKDAMRRIRRTRDISQKYCLKVDISNYFNAIDVPLLLPKLDFMKREDSVLYKLFRLLLTTDQAVIKEESSGVGNENHRTVVTEKRGAMAGSPFSPFLANVYLMEVDWYFRQNNVLYFRYSDDILIFADTLEELEKQRQTLYQKIETHYLELNFSKVHISKPGENWEFLGFCYRDGKIDLSENTKCKIKGKIKRKAHALRRWQRKKGLSGDKAAKGFIKAMNHKLFDSGEGTEFSWSRWFFPILTTDAGLKEIDAYLQQYIRYCVTGRHYKGNYRITYEQMKEWGYRNLVYEYYQNNMNRRKLPH